METEIKKDKTSKIRALVGLFFILIGVISLINVGYVSQTIVIMFTFVFGLMAYWALFPACIAFGVYLIIFRNKPLVKFYKTAWFIGLCIFIFGLIVLLTVTAYYPSDTKSLGFNTFNQYFYDSWLASISPFKATGYIRVNVVSKLLSGGWFGHFFAALLNTIITPIGSVISTSIMMFIAVILIMFMPMKKLIAKRKKAKSEQMVIDEAVAIKSEEINATPIEDNVTLSRISQIDNKDNNVSNFEVDPFASDSSLKRANLYSNNDAPTTDKILGDKDNTSESFSSPILSSSVLEETAIQDSEEIKPAPKINKPFQLPPYNLLEDVPANDNNEINEKKADEYTAIINATFKNFNIGATVIGRTIGPRVTCFDVRMDDRASVQSLPRIENDISQRLGGISTRFIPVVQGKTTSGIEVPNEKSSPISFKELVKALPLANEKNRLLIPFGKNILGEIKYADLASFPHMLVAGATGSGKSVFVNSLIISLIYRNTPEHLRLVLIDPKFVEFSKYKNSPYLLCPVISEPSKAFVALNKLAEEMDARFKIFAEVMCSNIIEYNTTMKEQNRESMPYIVAVVDEFADLIQQNKKVESVISRLAAKARAAGIHLIIATQRPSVDVITGVVKSNLPVRVALTVADQESSRTILGSIGAEQLLGNGDMLASCPQIQSRGNIRLQGCYIKNDEIKNVMKFINDQREPVYDPRFLDLEDHEVTDVKGAEPKMSSAESKALADDELYEIIKENIYKREFTSISQIERENGIGFQRAGRMVERLIKDGLISRENISGRGNRVLKENFNIKKEEQKIGSEELTSTKVES